MGRVMPGHVMDEQEPTAFDSALSKVRMESWEEWCVVYPHDPDPERKHDPWQRVFNATVHRQLARRDLRIASLEARLDALEPSEAGDA